MMNKQLVSLLSLALLTLISVLSCAEPNNNGVDDLHTDPLISGDKAVVMFYNVENLFDTIANSTNLKDGQHLDYEFTPNGKYKYGTRKYLKKINHIASVISNIKDVNNNLPMIIGLCEVENRAVIKDLLQSKYLSKQSYAIIHFESSDYRGIDVALVYDFTRFKVLSKREIAIKYPNSKYYTRDLLYVKGELQRGDIFHIFVNHWKSRSGGQAETEYKRLHYAKILRMEIDKLEREDPSAKIIIMGDLNDEPDNKSVLDVLKANGISKNYSKGYLYNMMYPKFEAGKGSYYYKGWNMLDNIIVSHSLLKSKSWRVSSTQGEIFQDTLNSYKNSEGLLMPNRFFTKYEGYSDHYPIYINILK